MDESVLTTWKSNTKIIKASLPLTDEEVKTRTAGGRGMFALKNRTRSTIKAYLFLTPFLIIFVGMVVYPISLGFKLSLYGQRGARMWYIGFENYLRIFSDQRFWESFKVPLYLLSVQVPLMLFLATIIALLFETRKRTGAFYRFIYYLPYTIPGIVAGIVWSYIFSDSMSPLRPLMDLLGYADAKILTRPNVPTILLVIICGNGNIYLSSLMSIPNYLRRSIGWQVTNRFDKIPFLSLYNALYF